MAENQEYKVLIVDDEAIARVLLQDYCSQVPHVSVVGSCANAAEANEVLSTTSVDILLCDIQMPDKSGLDFVAELDPKPAVIFTTAYSQFALNGFDLDAEDYLLKPIALPRFLKAMAKAIERCLVRRNAFPTQAEYIVVRADHQDYKVTLQDILYLEAQHEYVTYHTTKQRITAYGSLKSLEESLPATRFVRVHKSFMVAIDKIDTMNTKSLTVAGRRIPISRSRKNKRLF